MVISCVLFDIIQLYSCILLPEVKWIWPIYPFNGSITAYLAFKPAISQILCKSELKNKNQPI